MLRTTGIGNLIKTQYNLVAINIWGWGSEFRARVVLPCESYFSANTPIGETGKFANTSHASNRIRRFGGNTEGTQFRETEDLKQEDDIENELSIPNALDHVSMRGRTAQFFLRI